MPLEPCAATIELRMELDYVCLEVGVGLEEVQEEQEDEEME